VTRIYLLTAPLYILVSLAYLASLCSGKSRLLHHVQPRSLPTRFTCPCVKFTTIKSVRIIYIYTNKFRKCEIYCFKQFCVTIATKRLPNFTST
jgi:hypothetical protein